MELNYFLQFAQKCFQSSYSQNLQDIWGIWENSVHRNEYFVEFGALAGINVSNSYLMERLGWDGIVAEPHPAYKNSLAENRNCSVCNDAVYSVTGEKIMFKIYKGMPARSTISVFEREDENFKNKDNFKEVVVETISLIDMLKKFNAPREIGYISIDTEGSELEILKAFDFNQYTFSSLCVEYGTDENRKAIFKLLTENGYARKFEEVSGHDDWYVYGPNKDSLELKKDAADSLISEIVSKNHDFMERAKNRNRNKLAKLVTQFPTQD